jgi:hypothetical protein
MKWKATNSDALKRAGVMFGIGVSIYAMKAVTLKVGEGDGELRTQLKDEEGAAEQGAGAGDRRADGGVAGGDVRPVAGGEGRAAVRAGAGSRR